MAMPTFCNISVSSTIVSILEGEYAGLTESDIILDFVEGCSEGVKFSFSFKESKSAYCVAVTLPHYGHEGEFICATFWGGELFEALFEAYLVFNFFEARRDGFYNAKGRIQKYEKDLSVAMKRFREEGNTPITYRMAE